MKVTTPKVALGQNVTVTVTLENSGKKTGDEVAQLYLHQKVGGSSRPVRQLKGFQRVTLKPGEKRELRFTITPQDLSYWSDITKEQAQDDSPFDVWIGGDSQASLAGTFEVAK